MRVKSLVTFISLFVIVSDLNYGWSESNSNQTILAQDNYFDRVAMTSSGKLVRFSQMPIKVYISPRPKEVESEDFYDDELNFALLEWEKGSDGKVSFQIVSRESEADIKMKWSRFGHDLSNYDAAGEAQLIQESPKISVIVTISLRNRETGQLFSEEGIRSTCLHEIGHAIGIWGHSNNKDDVMFPRSYVKTLSQRDKNTIKLIYSHDPGYSMHNKTISILLEEIKLQPENARLYYQLGSVYMDQKIYPEAISSFKRSLELNPNYFDARQNLVVAYYKWGLDLDRQGKVVEAIDQMKIALQLTPQDTNLRFNIALVYEHAERWDEAAAEYESLLSSDPQNAQAKNALINLRVNQGLKNIDAKKYDEALEALNKIPAVWRNVKVYDSIGYALMMQGKLYEAREMFFAALRIDPNDQGANQNLKHISSRLSQLSYQEPGHERQKLPDNTSSRLSPFFHQDPGKLTGRKTVYWPPNPELPQGESGGEVGLRFWVAPDGSVFNVKLIKKSGSALLDKLAQEYVEKIRFAKLDDQVEQRNLWGDVTIDFNRFRGDPISQQHHQKEERESQLSRQDVPADVINLKDGSIIKGEILEEGTYVYVVKTPFGRLSIDKDKVESINKEQPMKKALESIKLETPEDLTLEKLSQRLNFQQEKISKAGKSLGRAYFSRSMGSLLLTVGGAIISLGEPLAKTETYYKVPADFTDREGQRLYQRYYVSEDTISAEEKKNKWETTGIIVMLAGFGFLIDSWIAEHKALSHLEAIKQEPR